MNPRTVLLIAVVCGGCASLSGGSTSAGRLDLVVVGETREHGSGCIAFTRSARDVVHLWAHAHGVPDLETFEIGVTLPPSGRSEAFLSPMVVLTVPSGGPRTVGYANTLYRQAFFDADSGSVVFSEIGSERLSGTFSVYFSTFSTRATGAENKYLQVHGTFVAPRDRALERYVYRGAGDADVAPPRRTLCSDPDPAA